jgi:hypothetical protein
MPAQYRVRRDNRGNLREHPTSEAMPQSTETTAFVITESHPTAVQLRLEDPIFFPQEDDRVALLSLQPAA